MSTQAFGAAPPPERDPEPETPAKRSPLLLFGAPALAALLVAGGLSYVLLGGSADDDLAAPVPPATPAPADPTPSPDPSTEAPPTVPLSASRNPFDPLVREPAGGAGTVPGGAVTPGGLTGSLAGLPGASGPVGGSTGATTSPSGLGRGSSPGTGSGPSSGSGPGSGGGSGPGSGNGSGPGSGGGTVPGSGNGSGSRPGGGTGPGAGVPPSTPPPAAARLDAVATCTAGDELWSAYRSAMTDASTTHTMAGHGLGPVTGSLDSLVTTTSVEELRQPLRTWARASASVRTQLVSGAAVRDVEPANPLDDSTGGTPRPGVRPVVDQSSILLARTAVRERCYQLTDPLVKKGDL